MGKVVPGVAVLAVVLADCSPLPLAQVGPPLSPWSFGIARLFEPDALRILRHSSLLAGVPGQRKPKFYFNFAPIVDLGPCHIKTGALRRKCRSEMLVFTFNE